MDWFEVQLSVKNWEGDATLQHYDILYLLDYSTWHAEWSQSEVDKVYIITKYTRIFFSSCKWMTGQCETLLLNIFLAIFTIQRHHEMLSVSNLQEQRTYTLCLTFCLHIVYICLDCLNDCPLTSQCPHIVQTVWLTVQHCVHIFSRLSD